MKLTLETSGGFAAAVRRPPRVASSETLNADEHAELSRLVQQVQHAPAPPSSDASKFRDSMLFTISVEEAGHTRVFQARDFDMNEAFGNLMRWIDAHAMQAPSGEN